MNFPSIEELLEGRFSPREFWSDYLSAVQYWIQRLIRRTNDELIENFGTQTVDLELVLSGTNAKFGVNATTRLTKMMSLTTSIDLPNMVANSQAEVSLTFTGVAIGDEVTVCPAVGGSPETGLLIGLAWVDAVDMVKVRFFNLGSTQDPAARSYRVSVRRYV